MIGVIIVISSITIIIGIITGRRIIIIGIIVVIGTCVVTPIVGRITISIGRTIIISRCTIIGIASLRICRRLYDGGECF